MTENLAARGEGLAGLGRGWLQICDKIMAGKGAAKADAEDLAYADGLRHCAADLKVALAAAPAGTPDVFDFVGRKMATHLVETMQALEGFAEPVRAAGQSALEEFWFRATGHHIDWDSLAPEVRAEHLTAALATPSPQAPQEPSNSFSPTSAREQSSATASDSLDVAAQTILKPHWPSVRNMEESEARRQEVLRVVGILNALTWQAAKEESDKWYKACRNPRADDPRAYCISKAVRK